MKNLKVKISWPYEITIDEMDVQSALVNYFKKHRFEVTKLNSMPKKTQGHYEIFIAKTKTKELCWRFIKNGKEIFRASETYKRRASARRGIAIAKESGSAEVV